ncbi:MAG: hypothetical protein BMS9Abin20_0258 [Acidimicrobiia bacterium]|nr:MAG: hypothetical protein BMS9Abin20_0258 [Acidimicrobiia bacterium]
MNHTAKNLIRFVGVVAGLGAAVWALRDRLLPAPEVHHEPPPRFRTVEHANDDLTEIKGIGPVKADKLNDAGITSFAKIAASSPDELAASAGTSASVAGAWIKAAEALS